MFVNIECKDSHFTTQLKISRPLSMIDSIYVLTITISVFCFILLRSQFYFFLLFNGYLGNPRVFKFVVTRGFAFEPGI